MKLKIHCPECGTATEKTDAKEAVEVAERHDDTRHDGESTTLIQGIQPPDFDDEDAAQIRAVIDGLQEANLDG